MYFFRICAIALALSLTLTPCTLFAQNADLPVDLVIRSTPSDPTPGASVVLEAVSFSIDVNQSTLTWTYDGKPVTSGFGKRQISVIAPQSGQTSIATVTISGSDIDPTTTSLVIRSGGVDLLWEGADAIVPPFYKGRPLLSPSGILRAVAIPVSNAPRQASFQWFKNDVALSNASGAGKASMAYEHSALDSRQNIKVEVIGGTFQGSGSVDIPLHSPEIIAYPIQEGFVNYTRGSRDTISIKGSGGNIRLEPFFFSIFHSIGQELLFSTTIDGDAVYGNPTNELRLSRPENEGTHRLTVNIATVRYTLQNLSRTFSLFFQ